MLKKRTGRDFSAPPLALVIRQRPTLPGTHVPSTIGAGGLNFRVRNGNGCGPVAIATEKICNLTPWSKFTINFQKLKSSMSPPQQTRTSEANIDDNPSPRPISTGQLNALLHVHFRPINVVFCHGPYPVNPVGYLILKLASHLDAFSGYPFRRSLTSHAPGGTTGTRELRPSRSSRTRDRSPQIPFGYRG